MRERLLSMLALLPGLAWGQILPSGVQGSRLATWLAVGARQEWAPKWNTTAFVGGDSQSDLDNYNAFSKLGIAAFNQETYYEPTRRWRLGLCNNVRIQGNYSLVEPYGLNAQGYRHEFRQYARIVYTQPISKKLSISFVFRPEARFFFQGNGEAYDPSRAFRTRYLAQANIKLDSAGRWTLFVGTEVLAATTRHRGADGSQYWDPYQYTETRPFTAVRYATPSGKLWLEWAVLHQFWLDSFKRNHYAAYLGMNVVFVNPLGKLGAI